jgi:uncharacterized RDD family membrane protein YckC
MPPATPPPALEPAPLLRRLAALAYDLLLLAALIFCFTLILLAIRGGREIPPRSLWFEACLVVIAALFFGGFWTHGGQTLGMRAWRIRVVTADGAALDWPRALARFAAAFVAALPGGLGLWWSVFDAQGRGWHDRWTRTRVVRGAPSTSRAATPQP